MKTCQIIYEEKDTYSAHHFGLQSLEIMALVFVSHDKGAIQRVDGEAKQKANHMPTEKVETVGYPNRYHQQAP